MQRDPLIRTIEGELVRHLERVLREPVKLSVAGRTDAGVHARGQVASFRTETSVTPGRLQKALNSVLAPEVVVVRVRLAPDGFDARFSATARGYVYRIDEAPSRTRSRADPPGIVPGGSRSLPCDERPGISRGGTISRASAGIREAIDRPSGTFGG